MMDRYRFKKFSPYFAGAILLAVLVSLGFLLKDKFLNNNSDIDGLISQREAKTLAGRVGEHIILPTDEVPTIATVSDPSLLKEQSFFAESKKGDRVLIYTNARRAVLYRPDIDKVVTVAPLNIGEENQKQDASNMPEGLKDPFIGGEF